MEVKPYKETLSAEDQNRMLEYYREKYDRPDLTKEEVCEYGPSWN